VAAAMDLVTDHCCHPHSGRLICRLIGDSCYREGTVHLGETPRDSRPGAWLIDRAKGLTYLVLDW